MEGESDPRFSGQKLQEQLLRHTVLAKASGSVSVRMLFQLECLWFMGYAYIIRQMYSTIVYMLYIH